MTSPAPPRDWTDIRWPDFAGRRRGALDRGAAAGGDRAARPAFAARDRRHDRRGLSGAGARAAAGDAARTFLPLQPVGISTEHIDYPGTLTLSTEAALKSWMALGESVARAGIRKFVMVTSHGGNSAAMTLVAQDLRAQHGLLASPRAGRASAHRTDCSRPKNCATASMAARSRPRSCWRDIRSRAQGGDRRFSPQQHRDGKRISLAVDAAARAVRLAGAGPAPERRCRRRHAGLRGQGRAALDHGARAFCELLAEVDNFDVNRLAAGPDSPPK